MREIYFKYLAYELNKLKPNCVLDIGCSNGLLVKTFRALGVKCYGLDIKPLGDLNNIIRGDARFLPFKDSTFDLITAIEVLEHISEYERVIDEMWRVLRPNRYVFITTHTPVEQITRALIGSAGNDHVVVKFSGFIKIHYLVLLIF